MEHCSVDQSSSLLNLAADRFHFSYAIMQWRSCVSSSNLSLWNSSAIKVAVEKQGQMELRLSGKFTATPAPLNNGIVNNAVFHSSPHINQTLPQIIHFLHFFSGRLVATDGTWRKYGVGFTQVLHVHAWRLFRHFKNWARPVCVDIWHTE